MLHFGIGSTSFHIHLSKEKFKVPHNCNWPSSVGKEYNEKSKKNAFLGATKWFSKISVKVSYEKVKEAKKYRK